MSPVLEDRLRDLFAATTQNAPSADDPATRAITRARMVRRRRAGVASAAAVLCVGASVYGLGALRPADGPSPAFLLPNGALVEPTGAVPSASAASFRTIPTGVDLDVRVGDQLWTGDGSTVALSGVGNVTRAYRVPIGWVYGGEHGVRLMLLEDGTTKTLLGQRDDWALDPAGERITFVADGKLHVAAVTRQGLAVTAGAPVRAGARPVGFVGDRVLISGGDAGYALFDPAAPADPVFDARVLSVLGPRADGETTALVRESGGDRVCLARLAADRAKLTVGTTGGCALGLTLGGDPGVRLSADGSHVYQADADGFRMIDTGSGRTTGDCASRPETTAVWVSADLLLAGAGGQAVSCRADGTRTTVTLPREIGAGWQYVPRLGAPA